MGKLQKDEAFYKKLWSLMVPIVLQNLMLAMVAVADAFMLGGMDQNYMSAVSLATQIQFIQNMFLAAATASLGILGAQYWGKGDKKTLDEIFCMALRLCGLVSAIFFVGCVFFGRYLMLIFTNEEVLINYGVSYLKIAGFSYLLTGIFSVLSCYNEDKRARKDNGSHKFNDSLCQYYFKCHFYFWRLWHCTDGCARSSSCDTYRANY